MLSSTGRPEGDVAVSRVSPDTAADADVERLTTREYWDKDRAPFRPFAVPATEFSELFMRFLPRDPSLTCVEIGAYPGRFLCDLARRNGYHATAIEFSDYCDHIAQLLTFNGVERFEVLQADFFAVQGRQFDVVTSFGFVEHFPDYERVIARHFELAKPGGYVVIEVPRLDGLQALMMELTLTRSRYEQIKESHNGEVMNLATLKRVVSQHASEILFADYFGGASIWLDWREPDMRPEMAWLVKHIADLQAHARGVPSSEFAAPYIAIVARKGDGSGRLPLARTSVLVRDARAAIERGDHGAAVSAIEACLAIDGSNADALALLGLLFLDKGATEEGLRLLEGVPKRMPDARSILMRMGETYRLRGDWARAEAAFQQVLLWAPRDREVLAALESTYAAHGDRTRADACREAIAGLAADSAAARK